MLPNISLPAGKMLVKCAESMLCLKMSTLVLPEKRVKLLMFLMEIIYNCSLKSKLLKKYLTGVLGLPMNLRGDRIFGSKENFSFTLSSTDGATYVNP